jgi:hypothetical protein
MPSRLELQSLLEVALGSKEVYFQPPSTDKIKYPCIVYARNNAVTSFADNKPYLYDEQYTITVIDKDPDSLIPSRIWLLPKCVFNRHFTADNLNHDVFTMFF